MPKRPECGTCGMKIPNKLCPECRPARVGANGEGEEVEEEEVEVTETESDNKAIWAFFIGAAIVGVGAFIFVKSRKKPHYVPISNPRAEGGMACLPEARLPGEWYPGG
jgi:LPXTG-motif cell wall-anchored protein